MIPERISWKEHIRKQKRKINIQTWMTAKVSFFPYSGSRTNMEHHQNMNDFFKLANNKKVGFQLLPSSVVLVWIRHYSQIQTYKRTHICYCFFNPLQYELKTIQIEQLAEVILLGLINPDKLILKKLQAAITGLLHHHSLQNIQSQKNLYRYNLKVCIQVVPN